MPGPYNPAENYSAEDFAKVYGRYQYRRDRAEDIVRAMRSAGIRTASEFFAILRAIGPYAWPGGYAVRYLLSDGAVLCYSCARKNAGTIARSIRDRSRDGWEVSGYFVHWEGPPEFCADCGAGLPSEYGDPDSEDESEEAPE